MSDIIRLTQEIRLAGAFVQCLLQWLTPAEMDEVRKRNASGKYHKDACASHDFCDANMAMMEAWDAVIKRDMDADSDADTALWNEAWDTAKKVWLTEDRQWS